MKEVQFGGFDYFDLNRLLEYYSTCKTVVVPVFPAVRFALISLVSVQFNPFPIWTASRPGTLKKRGRERDL